MTAFSVSVIIIAYSGLVFLAGFRPLRPELSAFELKRLLEQDDPHAKALQKRHDTIDDVMTIIRASRTALGVIFAYMMAVEFGWIVGGVIAVVGLLLQESLARTKLFYKMTHSAYHTLEPKLFDFATKYSSYYKAFRGFDMWEKRPMTLHSREELLHMIDRAVFLNRDEQQHLHATLSLHTITAGTIMTALGGLTTVTQNDLMGPLLLHELHETGLDTFAVTRSASDAAIVGTITISQLLTLEEKTSHKVKHFMKTDFPRFKRNMSIDECITLLTRERAFMGVVYDKDGECGVVTMDDCLRSVFGRKLG